MQSATRLSFYGLLLTLACGSADGGNAGTGGVFASTGGAAGTAAGGSSPSAGGRGAGAGGANFAGAGGANSAGAAGAIPIDALAEPWTAAICDYFARCLPFDAFAHNPGGCVGLEGPRVENASIPLLKAEIASGRVSYDANKIAACLASYATVACGATDAVMPNCLAAIDGTVALGDACTSDVECAGGARCNLDASCPGVCEPPVELGGTCSQNRDCGTGLGCTAGTRKCAPLAKNGEACRGPTASECSSGLLCVGSSSDVAGTCQAFRKVQVGAPCDLLSATVCADGSACVIVGETVSGDPDQICMATAASKGPCAVGLQDSCPVGEYCPLTSAEHVDGLYSATCRALATAGEACVPGTASCGNTGVCSADGRCIELGKVGETCQANSDCYTNTCVSNVCQLDLDCN